jgi:acetyl esterase
MQNRRSVKPYLWMVSGGLLLGMYSCNSQENNAGKISSDSTATDSSATVKSTDIKPSGPKPSWAPDIKPEMQAVIEKLASYNAPPMETLTAAQARKNPTPATAVMDLIKEHNIVVPVPKVDTAGKEIPIKAGTIHSRIYTPQTGDSSYPVIVYYHGGGWVIADLDTYDASAKGLSEQVNAIVVSVEYRKGPEHKFPAAHEDAFTAYQWVLKNAASFKGDPKRIAVAGESAGGNLAANVSIMARDKKIQMPLHQLLVYPVANNDMNSDSYVKNAQAKPLNKPMMAWFVKNYLPSPAASADPRISLVKANLKGLPPTTLITDEIDPLQSEGMLLRDKLKDAGVDVSFKNYDGVTHEFFGMAAIVPQAKDAQAYASDNLKKALKK